jgi:hypothetical protein
MQVADVQVPIEDIELENKDTPLVCNLTPDDNNRFWCIFQWFINKSTFKK